MERNNFKAQTHATCDICECLTANDQQPKRERESEMEIVHDKTPHCFSANHHNKGHSMYSKPPLNYHVHLGYVDITSHLNHPKCNHTHHIQVSRINNFSQNPAVLCVTDRQNIVTWLYTSSELWCTLGLCYVTIHTSKFQASLASKNKYICRLEHIISIVE